MTFENMNDYSYPDIKGYILMMMSDRIVFDYYPPERFPDNEVMDEKLLDMRIFNSECEYRVFRAELGNAFVERVLNETEELNDWYDDKQFLDIDTSRSNWNAEKKGYDVIATGGGSYFLPYDKCNDVKIKIRKHIAYDDGGHAYISDWRLVELISEEDDNNGILQK